MSEFVSVVRLPAQENNKKSYTRRLNEENNKGKDLSPFKSLLVCLTWIHSCKHNPIVEKRNLVQTVAFEMFVISVAITDFQNRHDKFTLGQGIKFIHKNISQLPVIKNNELEKKGSLKPNSTVDYKFVF